MATIYLHLKTNDFLECNIQKTWDMEKKSTIEYPIILKEIPSNISKDINNKIKFIHFSVNESNDYPICALSLGEEEFIEHNIQIINKNNIALVKFEIKGKTNIKKDFSDRLLEEKINANLTDFQFPDFIKLESTDIENDWDEMKNKFNIKCSKNLKGLN